MGRPRSAALLSAAILLGASPGVANGRFPQADYLLAGPGPGSDFLVLRTTFGLLVSRDGGRRWQWVCEPVLSPTPLRDEPIALGSDRTVAVGLPDGLTTSNTLCDWTRVPGGPTADVVDLTQDATGEHLAAAVSPVDAPASVLRSDDRGHTWATGAMFPRTLLATVDVAPGSAARVYLSGNLLTSEPVLWRSDDGGRTVTEATRDFGQAAVVYIAAVDPTDADVLYLRTLERDRSSVLWRAEGGGARLRRLTQTRGPMVGFALSDDGTTIWIASPYPDEGIQRSIRGGPFVHLSDDYTTRCLRYHAGVLYQCADEFLAGYALARSTDNGDHFTPILSLRDTQGPLDCPADAAVTATCGPLWLPQRMMLPESDGGVRQLDGGADAGPPSDLGAPFDAEMPRDAGTRPPDGTGCGCRASGTSEPAGVLIGSGAFALACLRRRSRRARPFRGSSSTLFVDL